MQHLNQVVVAAWDWYAGLFSQHTLGNDALAVLVSLLLLRILSYLRAPLVHLLRGLRGASILTLRALGWLTAPFIGTLRWSAEGARKLGARAAEKRTGWARTWDARTGPSLRPGRSDGRYRYTKGRVPFPLTVVNGQDDAKVRPDPPRVQIRRTGPRTIHIPDVRIDKRIAWRTRKEWNENRDVVAPVILARDEWGCVWCGTELTQDNWAIDHLIPISKGGTNEVHNLQALCRSCHDIKGDKVDVWGKFWDRLAV